MRERTLYRIAWTCTIVGILLMYALLMIIPPSTPDIGPLRESTYEATGNIVRVQETERSTRITLLREEEVDVILVGAQAVPLRKGDKIQVRGSAERQDGQLTFFGDDIRRIG